MRFLPALFLAALGIGAAAAAWADCVDFDRKRAEAAGAALARKPPTTAQLGVPSLDGLILDGPRTTGDPKCDGPGPYRRFFYTTNLTLAELVARWYPVIRRRTEVDGMNREWFRNPLHGNQLHFTSGTRVEFVFGRGTEIVRLSFHPAPAAGELVTENQPYTASEIAEGTPWPGGAKGPRLFLRADQGGSVQPAAPAAATPPAASTGGAAATNCPPRPAQAGADGTAQRAGTEIGGALGGSLGRNIGGAVGGLLGAFKGGQSPAPPPADPNCP